jgi:hypothetical protein
MESHVMINFLPTVLNQLFRVLTAASNEEVAVNVTRYAYILLRHLHHSSFFLL